ncbi:MAG: zf-HC2 domain-containing protein [candidate division Zixibacteria bacterium]
MNCQEILDKICDYIDKELDPSICDDIEKHIKDCEPCVAFINTVKKTVELFKRTGEEPPEIPKPVSSNLRSYLNENISGDEEPTTQG